MRTSGEIDFQDPWEGALGVSPQFDYKSQILLFLVVSKMEERRLNRDPTVLIATLIVAVIIVLVYVQFKF